MKLFANYYDSLQNRPSYNFFLNLFFLKNISYFNLKNLNYIHIFVNLNNFFKIKTFKFNYSFYNNFIIYFIIINLIIQFFIIFIFI